MNRYIVITPLRDEEEHLEELYASMRAQTITPLQWILVDDGSTDGSGEMIASYAEAHDWVTAVTRPDRGVRLPGGGVVEAFMSGFEAITHADWDAVVKFDADLAFEPDFFRRCLDRFAADDRLGIGGGKILDRLDGGRLEHESHPRFHVRGATKIYRRACWDAIGGLVVAKGWDTIDEVKANQLGWTTGTFYDISLTQQRETGRRAGQWSDWSKNGRAAWFTGYHPLFVLVRAARVAMMRPFVFKGLALTSGYLKARVTRVEQIDDKELIAYVRSEQLKRLTGRPSIWR